MIRRNSHGNASWKSASSVGRDRDHRAGRVRVVEPGIYFVLDSDPATWSYNSYGPSNNSGFTRVFGSLVAVPPPPKSPTPPPPSQSVNSCPAQYPNCSCKGPGCTHPDLTAYGGNGPIGMTSPKSIHRSVN